MIADRNRRQRRKPRRPGGGATGPSVASLGDYAGFDRLIPFQPGELNANKGGITGTPTREEDWSLNMTGNWPGFVQKTSGSTDLDQGRTHNPVNEITAITAATGTDWTDPVHDRAGNMTTIPKPANLADGLTAIYDAWNRLVEVKDGQTVIARYEYDRVNRRIKSHIDSGAPSNPTGIDSYVHYYHNSAWQILETRQSDTPSAQPDTLQPKHQFVWSQRYIDAPVLRDENTGTNGLCDDDRLYYLNDANFNVTALLDTAGEALERYVYSPYGVVTIYDATWTNTRSTSSYANVTLYTGRELDSETGLYYYRNRYYDARLGRFVSRDPIYRYVANPSWLARFGNSDASLFVYGASNPTKRRDPLGLTWRPPPTNYDVCCTYFLTGVDGSITDDDYSCGLKVIDPHACCVCYLRGKGKKVSLLGSKLGKCGAATPPPAAPPWEGCPAGCTKVGISCEPAFPPSWYDATTIFICYAGAKECNKTKDHCDNACDTCRARHQQICWGLSGREQTDCLAQAHKAHAFCLSMICGTM